jgi:signal transduction histidine kinase
MKIKKRLNLNTVISIAAVVLIILPLTWSYHENSKVNRNMDLVEEIRNVAFERVMLQDDFLLHKEERAKIQWHAKSETLRRLLDVADQRFTDRDDRDLLREARKVFDATVVLFSAFMEHRNREESSRTKGFNITEMESMLISQASLKAYSQTDSINKLHVSVDRKAAYVRERSIAIVVFFMFAGITVIIANSLILNRLLNKRITELSKGVEILGAGNLEYRIDAQGDDELSALALGTNEMADKLKMSHTSVENLQQEIAAHKQVEQEKEKLQAELQQAMKMEAVGRLAGGVAHDFNNLLTVIMGYSELLLQKVGKKSPMHGEVEEIKRAGERAASLTQQLLAFSRKQIIEPKVVHLDHLVAEMNKMLKRLIGEDIALQATTGKSLESVKVDTGQFQQILMNLVVNARDALPDGGKIVIETANVDLDEDYSALHPYVKPGRFVMVAVSDTGKGMIEEVKAHIFEPFFTTKERGSGTGLGLATAYGAVKQAGGFIEVYSEVGIGTTFKIYLPRVEAAAAKSMNDDRLRDLLGGTETVLLVEDEDTLRTLCERILGDLGYQVMPARNGAEAIALAQGYGDRIDLLLTDVVMPGVNGSELAAQLVLHHPEMQVLFMSGYTYDAIGKHGVLDEGVSFIGKPYTPSALAKKVREVLDKA